MNSPVANPKPRRVARSIRGLMLAAVACAALSLGWSSLASADPYIVEICTPTARAADGLFGPFHVGGNPPSFFDQVCESPAQDTIYQGSSGGEIARGASEFWELRAPEGTLINSLEFDRVLRGTGSLLNWELTTGSEAVLDQVPDNGPLPANSHKNYAVSSAAVRGIIACPAAMGSPPCAKLPLNSNFEVELRNLRAILDDQVPPSVAGPELASSPARGTATVTVSAADGGSGINEVTLFVDGVKLAGQHDPNGGRCRPPYGFVTPCKTKVNASFSLDTTKLADGPHELLATASDASGQLEGSSSTPFIVDNSPILVDSTAPTLTNVSLSHKRLSFAKGKKRGNAALRFTTDEGGNLTIAIELMRHGKKPKRILSLTTPVTAGSGSIALGGKLAAKHPTAGGYRATVTDQDAAGNISAPAQVPFKILAH